MSGSAPADAGWVPVPGTDVVRGLPVRSPTLPPATHTNVWVLGIDALTVVDPASPWPDEQDRLLAALQADGRPVQRVLLTHHHLDHVSGAVALSRALQIPVVAHPETCARVRFDVEPVLPGPLDCGGLTVELHHTPGHAPGHLVAQEPSARAIVAGDMVAGVGTIAIDPDDAGDLGLYLASLERMRALDPGPLLPAHGPVLPHGDPLLAAYIAHRHGRTEQFRAVLDAGGALTPLEIAAAVYTELEPRWHGLAAVQVRAHLLWLEAHGRARPAEGGRWVLVA